MPGQANNGILVWPGFLKPHSGHHHYWPLCLHHTDTLFMAHSVSWLQSPRFACSPRLSHTVLQILQKSAFHSKNEFLFLKNCNVSWQRWAGVVRLCMCGCTSSTENDWVLPDRLLFAGTLFWLRTQCVREPINVFDFLVAHTDAQGVPAPGAEDTRVSSTTLNNAHDFSKSQRMGQWDGLQGLLLSFHPETKLWRYSAINSINYRC